MVLCGNKVRNPLPHLSSSSTLNLLCRQVDAVKERVVKPKQINFHRKKNLQFAASFSTISAPSHPLPNMYYEISAKSNYNFEKPFLWLAKKVPHHAPHPHSPSHPCFPLQNCNILALSSWVTPTWSLPRRLRSSPQR